MQFIIPYNIISLLPGAIYWFLSGSFILGLIIYLTPFVIGNFIFRSWYKQSLGTDQHFITRGIGNISIGICLIIAFSILRSKGYF